MENALKKQKIRLFVLVLLFIMISVWQAKSFARETFKEDTLSVAVNFKADRPIAPGAAIEINLSRVLQPGEKIAITIEQTDLTNLFNQNGSCFVYEGKLLPLPAGASTVTIYLVDENGLWKENARFPLLVKPAEIKGVVEIADEELKVENKNNEAQVKADEAQVITEEKKTEVLLNGEQKSGTVSIQSEEKKTDESAKPEETVKTEEAAKTDEAKTEEQKTREPGKKSVFDFFPTLVLSMKSQPFQSNFPRAARPAKRATFNDFTLQGSLRNTIKTGILSSESNFDFAGSSFKPETLQFGTKGKEAPDVDLASYLMNFQIGKAKLAWGHTAFGNNRHLVSSFGSRGLSFTMPVNKRFDVSAGVLNGTSIVGFGNFSGLAKIRHQVQGIAFGVEFFPKRKNAMRLEITGFNGYLQALSGISEGRVNDAERSRGVGLRFVTSDKTERFKLEFGYALSRFFNPQDKTLDPNGNAVPLPAVIRSAHYIESSYQVLKDFKLTKTKSVNLNLGFRYEYVEPLYRSLGASAGADKFSRDYSLDGTIGEIAVQLGLLHSNDNLRNVPSILKSLTRAKRFSIALPLTALFGKSSKPSPFLPRLAYSVDRTHQFGAGIPVNGGFEIDLGTIPDQINTNQTFTSGWQFKKFTVEYSYNRSFADNRQTERERADQLGWVHNVSVSVNPLQILSFNVGMNFESSRNFELTQTNRTRALTLGLNWTPFKGATFSGSLSNTLAGDAARTNNSRNTNYDMQFTYNFSREKSKFKKFGMQAFVRFADTFARNRDFVSDLNNRMQTRIMNAGITFNFF